MMRLKFSLLLQKLPNVGQGWQLFKPHLAFMVRKIDAMLRRFVCAAFMTTPLQG
jgi:hypothetical protein